MTGDIKSPRLLWIKGALFVLLGGLAGTLLLVESPSLCNGVLLATCVWAFCRAYYFAFFSCSTTPIPATATPACSTLPDTHGVAAAVSSADASHLRVGTSGAGRRGRRGRGMWR